ncbi:MAG: type II toxin-antitoxin system HipA family toxin [Candidatus Marinimicrobia bacterium]|nr:type II toxin-antitoxin system HipA family toxin [Candidatus Neomarinimicrobiota bacterium]
MSNPVEVKLWGTTIGYLGYAPEQTRIATFEYEDNFLSSGINISPLKMKYPPKRHVYDDLSYKTFKGLPGVFADSLPDKFGRQLIDQYMAEKNIPASSITALDRLLYVGTRGMGALEYHPAEQFEDINDADTILDIHMLSELAEMIISNQNNQQKKLIEADKLNAALKLIRIGSSAGGARSKSLIALSQKGQLYDGTIDHGEAYSYWLLKFDTASNSDRDSLDPKGMPKIEYIYSKIAEKCGINIPSTKYIEDGNDFHFLIERFDRLNVDGNYQKLHYASWAGLAHADRDPTGAYSYEQLILLSRELGLGQDEITELFRRAVFNIIGRNQDDHTKNFGFLMDKFGAWKLSPAFDMTYSYDPKGKWTKIHQIKLNRKQDDFSRSDLIDFGRYCNLDTNKSNIIISSIINEFSYFEKYAKDYNVEMHLATTVQNNLRIKI